MMRDFHMSRAEAIYELPLQQAFALKAWATEANPWGGVVRSSPGYVAQEADRRE